MRISCYYALIGVAHLATDENILAAIELAMDEVRNGAMRFKDVSSRNSLMISITTNTETDRYK